MNIRPPIIRFLVCSAVQKDRRHSKEVWLLLFFNPVHIPYSLRIHIRLWFSKHQIRQFYIQLIFTSRVAARSWGGSDFLFFLGTFVSWWPSLTVFFTGDPKQNVNSFMAPVSDSIFKALSHSSLGFVLHGSPINRHCKDSYWLLKNFDQSENDWKSYHGKQNRGYPVKEHKKLNQKMVS